MGRKWIVMGVAMGLSAFALDLKPASAVEEAALQEAQDETARLNAFLEEAFMQFISRSPLFKTNLGIKDGDYGKIDDFSEAAAVEQLEFIRGIAKEMKEGFDYEALSDDAKISYDLLVMQAEQNEAGAAFMRHGYIFTQFGGPHVFLANFLINQHRVDDESDMLAYVSRIREVARAIDQSVESAKAAAADGIRPPRFAYEAAIAQARALTSGAPFTDAVSDAGSGNAAGLMLAALAQPGTDGLPEGHMTASRNGAVMAGLAPGYDVLQAAWRDSYARAQAGLKHSGIHRTALSAAQGPAEAPLWTDAKAKVAGLEQAGAIDAARAEELREEARTALVDVFGPAHERLIAWLEADMKEATVPAAGVGSLPDGEAFYSNRLSFFTTTDLTAEEIHELGLREVARLRAEMEAVKTRAGFEGSLQEFFVHVRQDPENYFPDTDEGREAYLEAARTYLDNIKGKLPDYFGLLPKADLVVKRVEAFRERPGGAQHYQPGTPDGSRPGVYYVHLSDMTALPKNQVEVIAYHEGLPGHHMQISIAQELQNIPTFRKVTGFGVYIEGWALYTELLAKEMGAYRTPLADFGRLTTEIWRAIRLVVDTGLHAKGWSEDDAVAYFMANTPAPETTARDEVRRYLVIPGQAVSYKVGMLKILELRAAAREALGDEFDIRGFHDTVLGSGALPLSILERRVGQWVGAAGGNG